MTGSGGWAYFAVTHYILGIRPEFGGITIDPCIPDSWDRFTVTRRFRGKEIEIKVTNPSHVQSGVRKLTLDGREVQRIVFEDLEQEQKHVVTVEMG